MVDDKVVQQGNCMDVESLRFKTACHLLSHDLKLLCHSSESHFNTDSKLGKVKVVGNLLFISTNLVALEWDQYLVGQWAVSIIGCDIMVVC